MIDRISDCVSNNRHQSSNSIYLISTLDIVWIVRRCGVISNCQIFNLTNHIRNILILNYQNGNVSCLLYSIFRLSFFSLDMCSCNIVVCGIPNIIVATTRHVLSNCFKDIYNVILTVSSTSWNAKSWILSQHSIDSSNCDLLLVCQNKISSISSTITNISLRISSNCQIFDLSSSSIVCGDVIVLESICTVRQSVSHQLRRLGICSSKLEGVSDIVSTLIPGLAISSVCHVVDKSFNNINQIINSNLVSTRNSKCLVRNLCQHSTNCFFSNQFLVLEDQVTSITETSTNQSNTTDVSVYSIPGECVTTKAEVITPGNDNQSQVTSTGRSVIIRGSTISQRRILCL